MAVSTRLDPIGRDIRLVLDEVASPAARSRLLSETARAEIDKAAAGNMRVMGHPSPYETYVDGRQTSALETVQPDGTILAEFDIVSDVLVQIRQMLETASPVGSGDTRPGHPGLYKASHELIVDGLVVALGAKVPDGFDTAIFVNSQPYARKIERGLSNQAPDGVYQVVATLARSRFGNIAQIKFTYAAPLFGNIDTWAQGTAMESPGRRGAHREEWLRRQPAIQVTNR
jgi:hypothetical protein